MIRDTPCYDIAQQSGKGALLPGCVVTCNALADLLDLILGDTTLSEGLDPHWPLKPAHHLTQQFKPRCNSQNHTDSIPVHIFELALRSVLQDLLGHNECQELRGIGCGDIGRGNAEFHGIKIHRGEKGPPLTVGLIRG